MKDNLKERLNTQRTNKILLWQTMIIIAGGTLGLLIKVVNQRANWIELFLIIIGLITSIFFGYLISILSESIENLHKELKKEEV